MNEAVDPKKVQEIIDAFFLTTSGLELQDILKGSNNIIAVDLIVRKIVEVFSGVGLENTPPEVMLVVRKIVTHSFMVGVWFGQTSKASFGVPGNTTIN